MKIIIAVDGFASTGKSTLARQLAQKMGYTYIDTGAMYRAVTLYFLDNTISLKNKNQIEEALLQIELAFMQQKHTGKQITLLNGLNVEEPIRSFRVSNFVSEVSTLKQVRTFLVKQQQQMGAQKGIVMDGRDIGTVVFPQAELKLFITAQPKVRAERRFYEMKEMGIVTTLQEVEKNLQHRDTIDTTRTISPLKKAADAVVIDNSHLTIDEQLDRAMQLAKQVILSLTNKAHPPH